MSLSEMKNLTVEINEQVEKLRNLVEKAIHEGSANEIQETAVQQLLTVGTKLYSAKIEAECDFPPFVSDGEITATSVMIMVTEMLKSQDLELFELGMWQAAWRRT